MGKKRFQFFEFENLDPTKPRWMQRSFLDRVTRQVYLPVVDPEEMLLALMDNDLIQVNGNPYCPLRLYVERYPQLTTGLLELEQRVKGAA